MTQEDKQLLLKDLCARLPYGVFCDIYNEKCTITEKLLIGGLSHFCDDTIAVRPYLRPMSSMTKEEKKEFDDFCVIDEFVWKGNYEIGYKNQAIIMSDAIDWLLKKHFDYRGLIPKGLAIAVTTENNPYKE